MNQALPVVLYIEDNPLNIALVSRSLRGAGYRVLEAVNGKQGVNMAMRHRPDLVLMDLRLSDMSGMQVASCLRRHPLTKHVAILALTSELVNNQAQWCQDNGFDGFLSKPVPRLALLRTVQQWIDRADWFVDEAADHDDRQLEETKPDLSHLEDTRTSRARLKTKPYPRQNVMPGS